MERYSVYKTAYSVDDDTIEDRKHILSRDTEAEAVNAAVKLGLDEDMHYVDRESYEHICEDFYSWESDDDYKYLSDYPTKQIKCQPGEFGDVREKFSKFSHFTVRKGKAIYHMIYLSDNSCGLYYAVRTKGLALEGRRALEPTTEITCWGHS